MDRAAFRVWFWNPVGALRVDDLIWSVEGTRLALSIDGSEPYYMPAVFVSELATVL